jgi:FkbH-like protein
VLKLTLPRLDYFALTKRARHLSLPEGREFRVALLGDVSTQHLVPLLEVLIADSGFRPQIYEAGFDTVELEVLNPDSELYAFAPQLIVILQGVGKLRALYYDYPGDRHHFVRDRAEAAEAIWKALRSRTGASVVQSTFVLPYERPFGNYGLLMPDTLHGAVAQLNQEIKVRAREYDAVLLNDVDYLAGWVGRRDFVDERLWALSKSLCSLQALPNVAQNIVDIGLACQGCAVKCIVLDLDNTLWGGIVGDDGIEGIELGDSDPTGAFRSFQQYIRELGRRGILLAVCSKNDEAVARHAFRTHPGMVLKDEDICMFVANWEDKAANIRRIRNKLNIGFDSMVFLDDNPFERNLVRDLLPEVLVPELPEDPTLYVRAISELNLFETASYSEVDLERTGKYRQQEKRDEQRTQFADLDTYLASLETKARVVRFGPPDLPRIAQLLQRSNQFNLTTHRHAEAECAMMMKDEANCFPFTITVRDLYGDFGLINVVILRHAGDTVEVETFVMSCRVLQRGVEQLAMNKVFEYAAHVGARYVVGRYIPTAKNAMVKNFFPRFDFHECPGAEAEGTAYRLEVNRYESRRVHITEVADFH